jgi:hypothetical protein
MKRCDSRCWNAEEEICDCICQGIFHGKNGYQVRSLFWHKAGRLPRTPKEVAAAVRILEIAKVPHKMLPPRTREGLHE